MTEQTAETGDTAAGSAVEPRQRLRDVRQEVIALLAELPQLPTELRVQLSGVAVELAWGGGARAEAGPAAPGLVVREPEAALPGPAPGDDGAHYVTAPTVGVFYRSSQPGARLFVAEGDSVSAGEQVAVVEAMKLFLPVEADRDGRVARFLVADGSSVEFGERLIALEEVA